MSNFKRQAFAIEVTTHGITNLTLIQKQIKVDTNPTNPQADIIATECKFWVMGIEIVTPTPKSTHPLWPPNQIDLPSPKTNTPLLTPDSGAS